MSIDYPWTASYSETDGTIAAAQHKPAAGDGDSDDQESDPFPHDTPSNTPAEHSDAISLTTSDLGEVLADLLSKDSRQIYGECLQFMERYVLTEVLRRTTGNQTEAARMLGITRGSLRYKIRASKLTVQRIVQCTSGDSNE